MKKYTETLYMEERNPGEYDITTGEGGEDLIFTMDKNFADFVTTACNNHYQLVESLEETLKCLENWMEIADAEGWRHYDYEVAKKARRVLEEIKQ